MYMPKQIKGKKDLATIFNLMMSFSNFVSE